MVFLSLALPAFLPSANVIFFFLSVLFCMVGVAREMNGMLEQMGKILKYWNKKGHGYFFPESFSWNIWLKLSNNEIKKGQDLFIKQSCHRIPSYCSLLPKSQIARLSPVYSSHRTQKAIWLLPVSSVYRVQFWELNS